MVSDLVDSSGRGYPLEILTYGGAPAPDNLPLRVTCSFPTAIASVLVALLIFLFSDFGLQEPRLWYDGNERHSGRHRYVLSSGTSVIQSLNHLVSKAGEDYVDHPASWSVYIFSLFIGQHFLMQYFTAA
jgi:hypothetical protein